MKIHGKDPWEWDEVELEWLIKNEIEETTELDYKNSRRIIEKQVDKISKEISAMSNANGGVVIYGIRTDRKKGRRQVPRDFDDGVDQSIADREWLEQVIFSNIQPPLENLRVRQIELKKTKPGQYVFVVYVGRAIRAHQAKDKKYYQRIDCTTKALEDYQIRDINDRAKYPILEPSFFLLKESRENKDPSRYTLIVKLKNKGLVRVRDWLLEFTIDNFQDVWGLVTTTQQGVYISGPSTVRIKRTGAQQIIFGEDEEQILAITSKKLVSNHEALLMYQKGVSWKVFADDSPPREGKAELNIS